MDTRTLQQLSTPRAGEALAAERADRLWEALVHRASGKNTPSFVYAVTSTGVVCRPGCPSRRPSRANVQFFDTLQQALDAGYRPCLRCRPGGVSPETELQERIDRVRRYLDRQTGAGETTLAHLGRLVGLSPAHLQRSFRAALGVSPAAYLRRRLADRLESELADGGSATSVTEAIYAAGYRSASSVYGKRGRAMGMTPGAVRRRGEHQTVRYCIADSPLGRMLVAATDQGICSIAFADTDAELVEELRDRFSAAERLPDEGALAAAVEQVLRFLEEPRTAAAMPLHVRATAFQQRVWKALQEIPAGETRTYSQLAASLGQPTAARAVARACATNPVAVLVPCHRVVGADGSLTGYRWGTHRKRRLLEMERVQPA